MISVRIKCKAESEVMKIGQLITRLEAPQPKLNTCKHAKKGEAESKIIDGA